METNCANLILIVSLLKVQSIMKSAIQQNNYQHIIINIITFPIRIVEKKLEVRTYNCTQCHGIFVWIHQRQERGLEYTGISIGQNKIGGVLE